MGLYGSLWGMVQVRLISADPQGALAAVNRRAISIYHLAYKDPLTVEFLAASSDRKALQSIADRRGDRIAFLQKHGLYAWIPRILSRPVLLAAAALILILTIYLPTKVFFLEVEGNVSVPTSLILSVAEEHGICFGADRSQIRSERLKNVLLQQIPDLKWAGVNTYGCRAVISIRERTQTPRQDLFPGISSIVAAHDALIGQVVVTRGTAVCQVGQSVKKGQLLISGYTDLGLCIRGEHAQGEVYGETLRDLRLIMPSQQQYRGDVEEESGCLSIIIGKKRINLFKGSGISPTTCDKMYQEYSVTLPGGFRLPITFVVERWTERDLTVSEISPDQAQPWLEQHARDYLTGHMIAGRILDEKAKLCQVDGGICLDGAYACYEMIGRTRQEEMIDGYEDR